MYAAVPRDTSPANDAVTIDCGPVASRCRCSISCCLRGRELRAPVPRAWCLVAKQPRTIGEREIADGSGSDRVRRRRSRRTTRRAASTVLDRALVAPVSSPISDFLGQTNGAVAERAQWNSFSFLFRSLLLLLFFLFSYETESRMKRLRQTNRRIADSEFSKTGRAAF